MQEKFWIGPARDLTRAGPAMKQANNGELSRPDTIVRTAGPIRTWGARP
jgi:hypothetical protein